jgi:hypothetical protein
MAGGIVLMPGLLYEETIQMIGFSGVPIEVNVGLLSHKIA